MAAVRTLVFAPTLVSLESGQLSRYSGTEARYFFSSPQRPESRDSAIGIATGYGLESRGVGVRVPVGQ
jgi:hypothetical protein